MVQAASYLFVVLIIVIAEFSVAQIPYATPQLIPHNKTACVIAHNAKRKLHCVPDLQWDDSLVPGAQAWALYHARKPTVGMEHSPGNGGKFRENIYYKFVHPVGILATWEDAVKWWYDEIRFYNYKKPGYNLPAAHFTQLIWKKTTKLGGAMAAHTRGPYTYTFAVVHYSPAGNVKKTFAYNVPDLQCKTAAKPYLKPKIVKVKIQDCLNAHNAKRNKHGVRNLYWDSSLASGAAAWALQLASESSFQPRQSPSNGRRKFGENTYYSYAAPVGTVSSCKATVQAWYNGINHYLFNKPGFQSKAAHFTQLIWKKSTKVGVGMAAVTKGKYTYTFIVARYYRPGNIYGTFSANVKNLRNKRPCRRNCPTDKVPYSKAKITKFKTSQCLSVINAKRASHGVPKLRWDARLARGAALWALNRARRRTIRMRAGPGNGRKFREIGFYMYRTPLGTVGSCADAVKYWYGQKKHYKFNNPGYRGKYQHFTQLIWKSSTKVGVGIAAVSRRGYTYTIIFARFSPPGNIYRRFATNVLRPIGNGR